MMRVLRRLSAWLRRDRLDEEMREELAQHVEWKTRQLVEDGMAAAEARRQAAIDIGNLTRVREESRESWGFPRFEAVLQDLRYGVRQIRRTPSASAVAIVSIAVGIGATTAVFSLANAVLLRQMAVRDPAALVLLKWRSGPVFPFSSLNGYGEQNEQGLASTSFSLAAYRSFQRDAAQYLDVLGFADLYQVTLAADGRAETATAHAVSGTYFDVLGISPSQGRAIGAIDDRAGAPPAALISDRLYRRRFGGDASAIGRAVSINNVSFTIVGVMPRSFHGTGQVGTDPDLYVPLAQKAALVPNDDPPEDPNFWWVLMLGRLKPGVTSADARGPLDMLLARTVADARPALEAKDYPHVDLLPGGRGQVEDREAMRDPLRTMGYVTLVVLLVACANVASLLLARGRARVRELSIRVAIGATRRRVMRQLLTEALLIAAAGCAAGVGLATWIGGALTPALSTSLDPADVASGIDGRVLAFAALLACACAAAFGIFPALRATDLSVGAGLQESRGSIAGGSRRRLSAALVVVQMALSLVLVAGATLLVRTVRNLEHVNLGFNADHVLLFRLDPASNGYDAARTLDVYTRTLDRLRGAPGVVSASLSSHKLISNSSAIGLAARLDESVPAPGSAEMAAFARSHRAWQLTVDERFFDTMGIPLVRGRTFAPADATGAPVVLVNRTLARQLFQTEDVVGRQIDGGSERQRVPTEIVGLVEDAHYTSVRDNEPPTLYRYYRQPPQMKNAATFEVRTSGSPSAFASSVRAIVADIDPALPVYGVMTQADQVATSLRQERLFARLATLLGTIALLLAAIGLYGLLAYNVARRTPEIGVRMALGAARGRVLWMVLRESLVLALLGLMAGVPLALAGTRMLDTMLFGLASRDPATLAAAAAILIVLAATAGYLPARRAARVDPLVALRAD